MQIFALIILSQSLIPKRFRPLADKALLNSSIKVPKGLREDTKYPGKYTYGNIHFNLLRILSSSQTTDIKGYAIEKNYAAIVKRKNFKIQDGFTLLDIQNQEFYIMDKLAASDDKINIYKVKPIDMFFVFSDIELKGKTPLLSYSHNYNWDEKRNKPNLNNLGNFSAGAGTHFTANIHSKVRFHSIKKAEISTDITLNGKVGIEVQLQKGDYEKYNEIQINEDTEMAIPGFGISFKFIGLQFEFGLYFTFGVILKDLEKTLKVDIDYFKGYQFTAKRYICIKRHGTSDSGWKTEFSSIPSGNIVEGSATDLEINHIKGTIQLNHGIKLKAVIASSFETRLSFGLKEPFNFEFGFSPVSCPYPYMQGDIEIPLMTYYNFTGVELKVKLFDKKLKYNLLNPNNQSIEQNQLIKTKKYCLFDSKNNNDYIGTEVDGGEGEEEDDGTTENDEKFVSLDAIDLENLHKTHSLISTHLTLSESTSDKQVQMLSRRATQFEEIDPENKNFDVSIVARNQSLLTSKVTLNFLYYTGTNVAVKSDDYSFILKDYTGGDGFTTISTNNAKKTEGVGLKLRINYCEHLPINEMYIPSMRLGVIEDLAFGERLCVIVKDLEENATDYVDENAVFTTDGTLSQSLNEKGVFSYDDDFFQIELISVTIPSTPDSGTSAHYEVFAEWGNDYQYKSLLIGDFSDKFVKGKNTISQEFKPKFRLSKSMRLFVVISYVQNFNIINLRQPITHTEAQKTASKQDDKIIVKTESRNLISCECKIERYVPIVRVNCSHENSTHRIISNIYTLSFVKPSEYKPQIIKFKKGQIYGVFEIKKANKNVKNVIIHMPDMLPLCSYSQLYDEYYQISFDKDIMYIPFRRENETEGEVTIKHVIQGNFVDEETLYFSKEYYTVDFDKTPFALVLVRTMKNEYSVTGVDQTTKTLIDYGDDSFRLLALEYLKDKQITISNSLIIIDQSHPFAEKTIPNFPGLESVVYHVWCERADEVLMIDKTLNLTTENNTEKDGSLFKLTVIPGHVVNFVPICTKNLSQSMCFFRYNFTDGYAIFRYPDKNGITILDTGLIDLFAQEDRQGLIEETIKTDKPFYYMTTYSEPIQIIRTYQDKIDLELRVIDVPGEYRKFCLYDSDGFIVPVSRKYYTDDYANFMEEFGIESDDSRFIDFVSGKNDSCIYAYYASISNGYNETEINNTDDPDDYNEINSDSSSGILLSNNAQLPIQNLLNPSERISDLARSISISHYKSIKDLVPPEEFNYKIYSSRKVFENEWINDLDLLTLEISDYFVRTKLRVIPEDENSIYVLYLSYKEFNFKNELNNDEYISAKKNMTIHYLGGKLNYLIPEKYHTIIDLGESNEISLNLIGKGSLELRTTGHNILKIKGKINIDTIKTIIVSDNVDQIEIDSVNIANYVELYVMNSLNKKVGIKIANLTLFAHSRANLTEMEITDFIIIKQTATAVFDDTVIVNNATMFIDMVAYQNDLIPMVEGSLIEPPKSISIRRSSNDGPKHDEEYIIFDGQFDCQLWIERMKFSNSLFNTARCSDINDTSLDMLDNFKETRAFVSFVRKEPIKKEKTYMPAEMIALIVIGCICFALLIAIIVVIVIKLKMKVGVGNVSENP